MARFFQRTLDPIRMPHKTRALFASSLVSALAALLGPACANSDNIHDTPAAAGQPCINCHSAAYDNVQTPKHVGVYPTTCNNCHSTTAWYPSSGGHPESKFPITTGSHANPAIRCTDCHIASMGPDTLGQNTDCIHCHIGAHTIPSVDSAHTGVSNYTPASTSMPHACLTCHPSG